MEGGGRREGEEGRGGREGREWWVGAPLRNPKYATDNSFRRLELAKHNGYDMLGSSHLLAG